LTLDNRGALITSAVLRDYESDFNGPLQLVVSEAGIDPTGMLALASPADPSVAARANEALYRLTIDGVDPGSSHRADTLTEIRWQWVDGNGWSVDKRLTVSPDGYLNLLSVSVRSPQQTPIFITVGPGLEKGADNTRAGIYLMKGAVYFDGADVTHVADDDLVESGSRVEPQQIVWGGIQSNYFVALFAPQMTTSMLLDAVAPPATADDEQAPEEQPGSPGTLAQFGMLLPPSTTLEVPLFLGPKSYELLSEAGYGLERAVDYGMFSILARPVAVTLEWLSERVGNYGLAIILATLGVRLIFFPLSQSSMKSMRKMQQLQPQMNAIRAKYKGVKDIQKRQEMNTEVMQLYKDHGVSPLGGCLPMLLQMPVLFAFYAAISVSLASRQAPLGLWIQDLSKMDPYYVLPLLMGASMYAQQRMSPSTGDPMQQRIFRLMPVMFTFFFLTFPSGLVIYWLVNTVLGIAQQAYVNHQLGAPDAKATSSPKSKKASKGQKKGGGAKRKKRGK
jgi:YidC/Oxa1 family membrane protein insertase